MQEFRGKIKRALQDHVLQEALATFGTSFLESRARAYEGLDFQDLRQKVAAMKDRVVGDLSELADRFAAEAARRGAVVYRARGAAEARRYILELAQRKGARRVVKSKSMASEEIELNQFLEAAGLQVTETDLGEWIIQQLGQRPSHMVMPAIHLTRKEVADLFSRRLGEEVPPDIPRLVKLARQVLRQEFLQADIGISGANMAVADTGTVIILTNEGNGRLTTTLPPIHVVLVGYEKLIPTLRDALPILKVLPRSATAQEITSYVTFITGPVQAWPKECRPDTLPARDDSQTGHSGREDAANLLPGGDLYQLHSGPSPVAAGSTSASSPAAASLGHSTRDETPRPKEEQDGGEGAALTVQKELHIILLDNGRLEMAADPLFRETLRCVRCASCLNVCPVYQKTGGHVFGNIYGGAIGTILNSFLIAPELADQFQELCVGCGRCRDYCPTGIDLPNLLLELRQRKVARKGLPFAQRAILRGILRNRRVFHSLLRAVSRGQKPFTHGTGFIRHLPLYFAELAEGRSLPAIAEVPLRDRAKGFSRPSGHSAPLSATPGEAAAGKGSGASPAEADGRQAGAVVDAGLASGTGPAERPSPLTQTFPVPSFENHRELVSFFAGCLIDFVYPEQGEAVQGVLHSAGVGVSFPLEQNCCGAPALYLGDVATARDLARQNIMAFEHEPGKIISACPTCTSTLLKYPELLKDDPLWTERAQAFAQRVRDFSSYVADRRNDRRQEPGTGLVQAAPAGLGPGTARETPKSGAGAAQGSPQAGEEGVVGAGELPQSLGVPKSGV
ncbi:MAG: LUD domain-containing protein [Firmicutes bacterium]|nr:LUD domain-containing protein [Bacillota bacterium]